MSVKGKHTFIHGMIMNICIIYNIYVYMHRISSLHCNHISVIHETHDILAAIILPMWPQIEIHQDIQAQVVTGSPGPSSSLSS